MSEVVTGTKVRHDRYGQGLVNKVISGGYEIFFEKIGKTVISEGNEELEIQESPADAPAVVKIDKEVLEDVIGSYFEKHQPLPEIVELGDKWIGGSMLLKPADESLQAKEIPIEAFFHKIVMMRDKVRVLEQNINSNKTLTDEEKVHIQQYISRVYGSFTTFNVLFKQKADYFSGK